MKQALLIAFTLMITSCAHHSKKACCSKKEGQKQCKMKKKDCKDKKQCKMKKKDCKDKKQCDSKKKKTTAK